MWWLAQAAGPKVHLEAFKLGAPDQRPRDSLGKGPGHLRGGPLLTQQFGQWGGRLASCLPPGSTSGFNWP